MPSIGPIRRTELIHYLRQLGFSGPKSGGRHEFMLRGKMRLILPNPHRSDISVGLLLRLLRQAGVANEEWEAL